MLHTPFVWNIKRLGHAGEDHAHFETGFPTPYSCAYARAQRGVFRGSWVLDNGKRVKYLLHEYNYAWTPEVLPVIEPWTVLLYRCVRLPLFASCRVRLGSRTEDLAAIKTHQWFAGFDWGGVQAGECFNQVTFFFFFSHDLFFVPCQRLNNDKC